MAQDFGDDMGNALLNFVTRQTENYLRFGRGRERAFDWWQRHYKKEGNTPEQAKTIPSTMSLMMTMTISPPFHSQKPSKPERKETI